ncbi:MAG: PAS domain S-box protein [Nitrospirae bacterium]|nr:MAG: PAS domain S-box protein [Nitrospirota bacterium]
MEEHAAEETGVPEPGARALEEECRQLRQALRESEERYRRITLAVTDYVFTVTVDNGRAVHTEHGPACVAVTGYTAAEFTADPHLWYSMVVEVDREMVLQQARRILGGEDPGPVEHRIRRKEGEIRWVSNTPVLQFDPGGRLISYNGLIRDITARKQAEADNVKLIAELQAALAKVKLLSGFLPICSNCKKIRDDKGYWTQLEAYIHEHSDAEFSHGICPECTKLLYPDYYRKNEGKEENNCTGE